MTTLPPATDFTDPARTEGQFKTAITSFRTFIADLFGTDSADCSPAVNIEMATGAKQVRLAHGADVASAAALSLGSDGNSFDITGTTTITSIGTLGIGTVVHLHFDGAVTLTHHATNLIMPNGVNFTTAAGDELTFEEYATGDWRCIGYATSKLPALDGSALKALPNDVAFNAGFGSDMTGEDLVVQTYGELVMTRSGSFTGEAGYIDTVATGAAAIVDIEKNGTTIYTTKPQFAISANTLTAGTLKTDGTEDYVSGDRITFKVTQIGSTIAGQKLRFTAKGKTT